MSSLTDGTPASIRTHTRLEKRRNLVDRTPTSTRAHARPTKLRTLQIELDVTMAELAQAQETLKETLDKVATLEAQFDEANTKKVRCFFKARICFQSARDGDNTLLFLRMIRLQRYILSIVTV